MLQLDTCKADIKHKITCISASWLLYISQYGGIWYIKKKSNQGNLFSWWSLRRAYNYFSPSYLNNCIFSLATGHRDIIYNSRRGILGAVPPEPKISYHLFNVDSHTSKTKDIVKLIRKSKWHSQQSNHQPKLIHRIYYIL